MKNIFNSAYYFLILFLLAGMGTYKLAQNFDERLPVANVTEQASVASAYSADVPSAEESIDSLQNFTDEEILDAVEIKDEDWQKPPVEGNPYILSPEQLEQYDEHIRDSFGVDKEQAYGKSVEGFSQISSEEALVNYEDTAKCAKVKNKLNVENVITAHKSLKELIQERASESEIFPRKCAIHVMNKFSIGSNSLARCPSGPKGQPMRGAAKPCVSKNLVNLTYNSFVDITECLNLDAKQLLPKLSNESGMMLNTLGYGFDAGVGQLTGSAIEEVNKYYDKYMQEIEKAAIKKPSCLRVMQLKPLLSKARDALGMRCGLIAPPDNPVKNIMYMAIYNRRNIDLLMGSQYIAGESFLSINNQLVPLTKTNADAFAGKLAEEQIKEKFSKLGINAINVNTLATMIAFAGYNAGPSTAFNMLNNYLEKRIADKKLLTEKDFDFHNPSLAKDIDGKEKSVTEIARLFARSPFIKKGGATKLQLQRIKMLPEKIRKSHLLSFPEYIIYNQNNFYKSILNPKNLAKVEAIKDPQARAAEKRKYASYAVIGAPGYLSFLAAKDMSIRQSFETSGASPFYCSDPKFLKIK